MSPRTLIAFPPVDAAPRQLRRPRPARPPLRLTRRGRRLLAALRWAGLVVALTATAVATVLLAAALVAPGAVAGDGTVPAGSSEGRGAGDVTEVVVAPGDTLWALAGRHAPDRDPRDFVAEVYRLNDLPPSGLVRAGESLLVPVG
ncbi:MAG: hypothetical protein ACFCVF_01110 [Kineosporiaceae bacterium]